MFKKIFNFLKGYVIIEIAGKNKERFINMCLANNLRVWDVKPMGECFGMSILSEDFKKIRRLVRKSGVRVKIKEKHSRRHYVKINGRRYGFIAAGILACIYFVFICQYIWCVEIEGAKTVDTRKIENILREQGVYVGAKKSKTADLTDIKNAIIFGDTGVNWAWLYMDGAKARVVVQEMTLPPDIADKKTPTDIIAGCDGIIKSAQVRRGERRVNKGMAVTKGQVLVSGKVAVFKEGEPERYSYVHSDGKIIADTIRTETVKLSHEETLAIRTGNAKKRFSLDIFGKHYEYIKTPYENTEMQSRYYDLRLPIVGYIGITLGVHNVYEVNKVKNVLTDEEVVARAKEELEERICKQLSCGAKKTSEDITYTRDGDTYIVTMRMRLTENIGIEIPSEE